MKSIMKILALLLFGSLLAGYTASVDAAGFARSYGYPIVLILLILAVISSFDSGSAWLRSMVEAARFCVRLALRIIGGVLSGIGHVVGGLMGLSRGRSGARFMRGLDRLLFLNRFNGGFLMDGKHGRLRRVPSFQSGITVAGQGAGKSSSLVIPNLFTLDHCSLVITDTKGSIYAQTSGDLARRGFDIKVLNLMEPARSHAYNPLSRSRTPLDVIRTVEMIYRARGGRSGDPFWDDGAMRVLRIMAQCLINRGEPERANLANVKHLLDHFDGHKKGGRIDGFVVESTLSDPQTYSDYRGLIGATPEKTLLSFVTEAATALRLFASPEIAALMARDQFDFSELRERKTALYVMCRQQDMGVYGFILNMFFRDLFDELLGSLSGSLPVFMLLDEFGHLKVPNFEVYATTAREYRVGFWLFLQSLGQLEHQYGRSGAETILDGIGTRTFFGGMGLDVAERLSRELGMTKNADGREERLMRPEAIRGMEDGSMLLLHRNKKPALLSMTPYFQHRQFKKRAATPAHPLPDLPLSFPLVDLDGTAPAGGGPVGADGDAPPADHGRDARDAIAATLIPPSS